ncbi:hypothetical protein EB230_20885 [Mesorhizobium sp. NZP2234]|uniref:hypothetical protein n=1 Tax=Mesorhizobium sp. NZP2234 TaxID=2483402 RepID=UPI0015523573|nr:hypothetical protein [Mesorhizobium sp. NZP2234]QKC90585.1 hypothetical protein EB230_20885 [Mesorhizobium sp. NZP2234]
MGDYTVELIRDCNAVRRADFEAENVVEAATIWGPVTIPPDTGEWIRVTHPDGCTTTWFEMDR